MRRQQTNSVRSSKLIVAKLIIVLPIHQFI
jgi:hypothetical protein